MDKEEAEYMNCLFIKKAAMIALPLIPACSSAATATLPSAPAASTFEPNMATEVNAAVIEFPSYNDDEIVYSDLLTRMNGWLKKAGQMRRVSVMCLRLGR